MNPLGDDIKNTLWIKSTLKNKSPLYTAGLFWHSIIVHTKSQQRIYYTTTTTQVQPSLMIPKAAAKCGPGFSSQKKCEDFLQWWMQLSTKLCQNSNHVIRGSKAITFCAWHFYRVEAGMIFLPFPLLERSHKRTRLSTMSKKWSPNIFATAVKKVFLSPFSGIW